MYGRGGGWKADLGFRVELPRVGGFDFSSRIPTDWHPVEDIPWEIPWIVGPVRGGRVSSMPRPDVRLIFSKLEICGWLGKV